MKLVISHSEIKKHFFFMMTFLNNSHCLSEKKKLKRVNSFPQDEKHVFTFKA